LILMRSFKCPRRDSDLCDDYILFLVTCGFTATAACHCFRPPPLPADRALDLLAVLAGQAGGGSANRVAHL